MDILLNPAGVLEIDVRSQGMIAAFGRSQHREAASEWRRLFDVNLFGHIAMTQALLPALIESRGTGQTTICTCCPVSNFTIIGDIDPRHFEPG